MTIEDSEGTSDRPVWTPSKYALSTHRWGNPGDKSPVAVLLDHPTTPYPDRPMIVDQIDDQTLRQLAYDYLRQAHQLTDIDLGLPPMWLDQLNPATPCVDHTFGWLPIREMSDYSDSRESSAADNDRHAKLVDPLASFRVARETDSKLADEAVILLASEWSDGTYLGSEFGLRVVASVQPAPDGKLAVSIIGMSASVPFGPYLTDGISTETCRKAFALIKDKELKATVKAEIAHQLHLQPESVYIRGVRIAEVGGAVQVERRCTGVSKTAGGGAKAKPYSFVFLGTPDRAGVLVSKTTLVADATPGFAHVFPLDPASASGSALVRKRRPTRSEAMLDLARSREQVTKTGTSPLAYPEPPPSLPEQMRVAVCPKFVLDDSGTVPGAAKSVPLPDTGPDAPRIRSNNFAAISAYQNIKRFFQRLDAYGLGSHRYFQVAKLPLKIFYRSGVQPGPSKDGQAVNARVFVEGWTADFEGPTTLGQHPGLEMHLALADLSTRSRKPWNGKGRSPAEPLGIAADPRWIWHELGHVLLMASVGELQFRFAHSPGDSLAAIIADPESKLATDPNWRGSTFPWVFLPRRHDRCVTLGWSWGGSLHHALSQVPNSHTPRRKAYWSEQILSSSLFRLYRSLGGDTTKAGSPDEPDRNVRESASHYSVFLIMKGIHLLGPSAIVPAFGPEQFVSALGHSDTTTGAWNVAFPPDSTTPLRFQRVGGCTHKVIRWAFEAQGMFNPPGTITNAPGAPPHVDVYVADRRPTFDKTPYGDINFGPGSYNPVSLEWDHDQSQSGPTPSWQATEHAVQVGSSDIKVRVGNRGTQTARNVRVRVSWCAWPASTDPPLWNDSAAGWSHTSFGGPQDIDPGEEAEFDFSHTPPAKRYIVVAQATCNDDRANTDVATFACSYMNTPLVDLVSGDNNIGLRVLNYP